MPPPTWTPGGVRPLRVDGRALTIPLSLVVLATLFFVLRVPLVVIAPLSFLVPALYVASSVYVARRLPAFEHEFNRLLVRADADSLWRLYQRERLLRFCAPAWLILTKLGLILTLRGQFRAASGVLEEAYERSPKRRRADLLGPLARAKYELGDIDALRELASQWRARSPFPGAASVYLAAAYAADPREDRSEALELLEEVGGGLSADERRLRDRLLGQLTRGDAAGPG